MTGTIYLGGGGDATDEGPLWRAMLRDKHRLLYWPFALEPPRVPGAVKWLVGSLRDLGLDVEVVTWTDLRDHTPAEMRSAELLFVGGGNTFQLLNHVRSHDFLDAVRDFVAGGGDYYGGSAGAILACTDIEIAKGYDENDLGLADLTALGLVSGFTVLPHFGAGHLADVQAWSSKHGKAVLGIPERSGVVLREGVAEVLGSEAVWEVRDEGSTVRAPGERWVVSSAHRSTGPPSAPGSTPPG